MTKTAAIPIPGPRPRLGPRPGQVQNEIMTKTKTKTNTKRRPAQDQIPDSYFDQEELNQDKTKSKPD